ncbi:MAG: peptidylprolyl isomerase [Polyangia bacterium]
MSAVPEVTLSSPASGRAGLRRIAAEPLVHFVVLALLLLGAQALQRLFTASPERIRLGREEQAGVAADLARRLGRAPTADELRAAVSRLIDDEVLVREALRRGLDQGDVIVRRRLIQKMELLAEALTPAPTPTDAELLALRDRAAGRYREPARVALEHVFVSRDRSGPEVARRAEALRRRLVAGEPPTALGEPFPHGAALGLLKESQLAAIFGAELARAALLLPPGAWSAPLPSSYGLHVVRVTAREEARLPSLDELRERLIVDLRDSQRDERRRLALDALRARYTVELAPLDGTERARAE